MMNQASSVNDPAQVLATYMGHPQWVVLQSLMDGSEESGFFKEIAAHLRRSVEAMPAAGGQRLDEEAPMVYLHYFLGASDVWVLEKAEGGGVEQVFAFSLLNGDHQWPSWAMWICLNCCWWGLSWTFTLSPSHCQRCARACAKGLACSDFQPGPEVGHHRTE